MILRSLCILVIGVLLLGCSATRPNKQTLKINCNIPGTIVRVNGDMCECPGQIDVRRDSKVMIEAYKDGYDRFTKTVNYHLSSTAKADIVGTVFLFFPVFGMLSPGAWDLDQTEVEVILNEIKP